MTGVVLDHRDKKDSEIFIENLQNANPADVKKLLDPHNFGSEPAWHRFVKGAYHHPVTWWVGLLQIQMQMGLWGQTRRAQAQLRSNTLSQALNVAWNNASGDMVYRVLVYNLKHRKADVLGRFYGGKFTNFTTTGGVLGGKHLPKNAKTVVSVSNFVLASYGASIKSVATGHNKAENIIQSIITGRPNGPSPYPEISGYQYAEQEAEMYEILQESLKEINALTQLAPAPITISEFCLRPENVNLGGLCK